MAFGNAQRTKSPKDLRVSMPNVRNATRAGKGLSLKKLENRVQAKEERFQSSYNNGNLGQAGVKRSELLGYRRALAKKIVGNKFGDLSRQQRRQQVRSALGDKFGNYFSVKPKGPQPTPRPGRVGAGGAQAVLGHYNGRGRKGLPNHRIL